MFLKRKLRACACGCGYVRMCVFEWVFVISCTFYKYNFNKWGQVLFDICNNTWLASQLNVDKKVQSTPYEEN